MTRPPLWLAAAAAASFWAAVYTLLRWGALFAAGPVHEDVLMYYVAAETGLRHGWPAIYDQQIFRATAQFPLVGHLLDLHRPFASTPLMAWLFAPLTALPEAGAYAMWTLLSMAALVFAWRLTAPYGRLARFTLLFAAVGLWPVLLALYFGQPTLILIAALAAGWWCASNGRPLLAGVAFAFAMALKPQALLLLPIAMLLAGQYRVVASWLVSGAIFGALFLLALGFSGLTEWWSSRKEIQGLPVDTEYTLQHFFGDGPVTYALWALQGAAALVVAFRRRAQLELVVAAGLLGSTATASYFHEADYSILILVALLFLRTSPPLWQRVWVAVGIVPMQVMSFAPGVRQPVLDVATHAPQLVFDAVWLGILLAGALGATAASREDGPSGSSLRREGSARTLLTPAAAAPAAGNRPRLPRP